MALAAGLGRDIHRTVRLEPLYTTRVRLPGIGQLNNDRRKEGRADQASNGGSPAAMFSLRGLPQPLAKLHESEKWQDGPPLSVRMRRTHLGRLRQTRGQNTRIRGDATFPLHLPQDLNEGPALDRQ